MSIQFIKNKIQYRQEHIPYYLFISVSLLIFIISLWMFFELTDELKENDLGFYDHYFSEKIQTYRSPTLSSFFQFITQMGDGPTYILLSLAFAAFLYILTGKWKFAIQTFHAPAKSIHGHSHSPAVFNMVSARKIKFLIVEPPG